MQIIKKIKTFSKQFYLINIIQTIERLGYWVILLQMPVYIAQKDIVGGLHWEQATKGIIFFWWALVQNLSPTILGGIGDKLGRRRVMYICVMMIVLGSFLLGMTREFYSFLFSTLLLGLGMGIFKPALQGVVSNEINNDRKKDNSRHTIAWGVYITFVNIAYFLGPALSVKLKSFGWEWIFYGSAIIHSLNLLLLAFIVKDDVKIDSKITIMFFFKEAKKLLKDMVKNLIRPEIILFIIFISCFTLNHMQFYETLPNFVSDWSDTTELAKHLPSFFLVETSRGQMISFEWIYNINSAMLVLFVLLSSYLTRNRNLLRMCSIGLFMVAGGLFLAGSTMNGAVLIAGVFILAIGEILITPRISQYFSTISNERNSSQYLGYANLSWTIGLSGGGIVGGFLYQHLGEKSSFAIRFLADNFGLTDVKHGEAIYILCSKTGLDIHAATELLWQTYHPWRFWIPFLIIGIIGVVGLFLFSKSKKGIPKQVRNDRRG
ncbi:MAG: MFS transporter [Bacteroidetes bacterium]|nr:MFS transporter [Bacteroidota bacterium]